MELEKQIAVVTGASRGIGKAIATRMASYGANLVLAARTQGPLDELVHHLKDKYGIEDYDTRAYPNR